MKTLSLASEKETTQEILKLLDGLPYIVAKKIIDNVSKDIFESAYVEIKPLQTYEVSLSTKKMDELTKTISELTRDKSSEDFENADVNGG